MSKEVYNYKRAAIKAAKELGYGNDVIDLLIKAHTEAEINNIMKNARLNKQ